MGEPIAGWYEAPSGDASRLRFWDGSAWTDRFMDTADARHWSSSQRSDPAAQDIEEPSSASGATAATQGTDTQEIDEPDEPSANEQAEREPETGGAKPDSGAPSNPYNTQVNVTVETRPKRADMGSGAVLPLIAFVFALLETIACAQAIIPLFWMIPMTVRCWGIYRGSSRNTVAFGVCSLIFLNPITGILLLCSPQK